MLQRHDWAHTNTHSCNLNRYLGYFVWFYVQSYLLFGYHTYWLSSKEYACNRGDLGLSPGPERSPGGGHGNPFQYSCMENPMDRRAWQATGHRVTQSKTWLKWLSRSVYDSIHSKNEVSAHTHKEHTHKAKWSKNYFSIPDKITKRKKKNQEFFFFSVNTYNLFTTGIYF